MIDRHFRQMFLLGIPLIAGAAWRVGKILQEADGQQKPDRRQPGGMNASGRHPEPAYAAPTGQQLPIDTSG
jgi:hypothetical protein